MAGEPTTIDVDDDGIVTIDLPDDGSSPTPNAVTAPAAGAETGAAAAAAPGAADQAAAELQAAMKRADDARMAAERTAESERRARLSAEEQARLAADDAKRAREEASDNQTALLERSIESAKADLTSAQQELERAMEAGEFAKAAQAQTKIATAAARLDRFEAQKEAPRAKPEPAHEGRVTAPVDPLEQYVSGFAPRAQTWLRAHPDCIPAQLGGNAVKNSQMMAGHYSALAQNLREGSEDYFRVIEEHIGERTPVSPAAAPATSAAAITSPAAAAHTAPARPAAARPAAPPSRDIPATDGTSQRRVTLTSDQQETALFSYPAKPGESTEDHRRRAFGIYAREYMQAKKDGQIGRLTH